MKRVARMALLAMLMLVSFSAACCCAFSFAHYGDTLSWPVCSIPRSVELESGDVSTATEVYFVNISAGKVGLGHVDLNATWIPPIVDGRPFQVVWDPVIKFPVLVPAWLLCPLALATGAPAALTLRRAITTRRRAAARQCVACGYDLRATPERCPECGTGAPQPALGRAES